MGIDRVRTCGVVAILTGSMQLAPARDAAAQRPAAPEPASIPLVTGLTIVSVLVFPEGDRENVVVVDDITPAGVSYTWRMRERRSGQAEQAIVIPRFVRAADLAAAPRLNTVFYTGDRRDSPGYTAFTLSTAVYDEVNGNGEIAFSSTSLDGRGGFGPAAAISALFTTRVLLKGSLSRVSPTPVEFPLLVNGMRVTMRALHLRGRFALREIHEESDYWVLADREHPLLLRIASGPEIWQVVSIELPGIEGRIERDLGDRCVSDLPGIHFAFGNAEIEPVSEAALEAGARALARHPDWRITIEGHTDSIGTPESNRTLSLRRAEAVRAALVARGVAPATVSAEGHGASRPREPNATPEGRARNRRVELIRKCATQRP